MRLVGITPNDRKPLASRERVALNAPAPESIWRIKPCHNTMTVFAHNHKELLLFSVLGERGKPESNRLFPVSYSVRGFTRSERLAYHWPCSVTSFPRNAPSDSRSFLLCVAKVGTRRNGLLLEVSDGLS